MKVDSGGINSSHERNTMRGVVILISTIFTNFPTVTSFKDYARRIRIVKVVIKYRIRSTSISLVCDVEVTSQER